MREFRDQHTIFCYFIYIENPFLEHERTKVAMKKAVNIIHFSIFTERAHK